MEKQGLLPLLAVLGGAAALLLRVWQNATGFEPDTGLPIPGAPAGTVLTVFLLVMAVLLFLLVRRLPKETENAPLLPRDFATEDSRLLALPVAGVLLIALSGLADLYEGLGLGNLLAQFLSAADPEAAMAVLTADGFSPTTQKLLGVLSLLSAAALFPVITACRKRGGETAPFQGAPLLLIPPVALVVRLVLAYRLDSVNPVLQAYYVELLALVFLTLGFYRLSSYAFQAGRTRLFAFYACASVVLCCASLPDCAPHLSSLLLNLGGALILLGFLLLRLAVPAAAVPSVTEDNAGMPPEDSSPS